METWEHYCKETTGNEECIPGQKQKDQSGKERGKMAGEKVQYNLEELDRNGAGVVVTRKAREYQAEHPGTPLADAVRVVCREEPKLAARYLGLPILAED